MNWKRWKFGFIVAAITGLLTAFAVGVIVPTMTLKEGILICLGCVAKDLLLFLKEHPYDQVTFDTTRITKPPLGVWLIFALGFALVWLCGCAKLQPGADPIVVRAEQSLTAAQGTFQFVLRTDELDRGFWRTNAPGFHNFAEGLRVPTRYQVTNTLPRYRVYLLMADDVKQDYKLGRASSNALAAVLSGLESLQRQSAAWLNVVTNRPH